VALDLPPLGDAACESFAVEVLGSGESEAGVDDGDAWMRVLTGVTTSPVTVSALAAHEAHTMRLRLCNARGCGEPSSPSEPALTDAANSRLLDPPSVAVASPTSFDVSWLGSASECRPKLAYSLQARRASAGSAWRTVVASSSRVAETVQLYCPEGCSFRLAASIPGWGRTSRPSERVSSPALQPPPPASTRLVAQLRVDELLGSDLQTVFAAAFGVRRAEVSVLATPAESGQVVIDLLSAMGTSSSAQLDETLKGRIIGIVATGSSPPAHALLSLARMTAAHDLVPVMTEVELSAARTPALAMGDDAAALLSAVPEFVLVLISGIVSIVSCCFCCCYCYKSRQAASDNTRRYTALRTGAQSERTHREASVAAVVCAARPRT